MQTLSTSERATMQRINRKLDKRGEKVCKCRRDARDYYQLGDYYMIDYYKNAIINSHLDLCELEKELGV